jgi:hypothetical protein
MDGPRRANRQAGAATRAEICVDRWFGPPLAEQAEADRVLIALISAAPAENAARLDASVANPGHAEIIGIGCLLRPARQPECPE